jgi:hypothetical protein
VWFFVLGKKGRIFEVFAISEKEILQKCVFFQKRKFCVFRKNLKKMWNFLDIKSCALAFLKEYSEFRKIEKKCSVFVEKNFCPLRVFNKKCEFYRHL